MPITWHGNTQVKTNDGVPLTSHGPALVVKDNVLYTVYVGQGGSNIWQSSTSSATSSHWQTNKQVKIAGQSTPLSSFRPALALFNDTIHMVYVGQGGANLWWSWFDGTSWAGNVKLPWSGGDPQPALAAYNGKLHLVWHDHQPAIYETVGATPGDPGDPGDPGSPGVQILVQPEHNFIHYSALDAREPLQVSSWQQPALLGDGGQLPALASYNGSLYMVLSSAVGDGRPPATSSGLLLGKWQNAAWEGWGNFNIVGSSPRSAGGVALAVQNNLLYIVYPGQGGANMWYAYMDTLGVIAGNIQIKTPPSVPETSAPLGLVSFQGNLCLAYKGESSNNLWFSYAM